MKLVTRDYRFTAATAYILQSSTSYFIVIETPPDDGSGTGQAIRMGRTTSSGTDPDSLSGWTLSRPIWTPKTDTNWTMTPSVSTRTTKIQLEGTQPRPPTSTPTGVTGVETVLASNINQAENGTGSLGTTVSTGASFRDWGPFERL